MTALLAVLKIVANVILWAMLLLGFGVIGLLILAWALRRNDRKDDVEQQIIGDGAWPARWPDDGRAK